MTVAAARVALARDEADKLMDNGATDQGRRGPRRAERHRVPGRDRQGMRPHRRGRLPRRRRVARGRAARPAAADRGHHRQHQVRPGQRRTMCCSSPPARSTWPSRPTCCRSCRGGCRSGWSWRRLSRADLRRILVEPEHSLVKQYEALLGTESVQAVVHADDAVDALAELAADINERVENIGARRLATVLEKLLEDISFTATDRPRRRGGGGCGLCARARGAAWRPRGTCPASSCRVPPCIGHCEVRHGAEAIQGRHKPVPAAPLIASSVRSPQ